MEVIRRLREWSQVPILAITPNGRESEGVKALDAGADENISRPSGKEELLTRMQVAIRRAAQAGSLGSGPASLFTVGELQVDLSSRRKLEANPSCPRYLLTEPRIGYRLALA